MSSEHAIEQVPLPEIREADLLQDPTSGRWIKVTRTADDTASGPHRVYYGDGGEEIDSRLVRGRVRLESDCEHDVTALITTRLNALLAIRRRRRRRYYIVLQRDSP
jgi:hypothetical protein